MSNVIAPTNNVTQDQIYKDRDAIKNASKDGGDVKDAVATLVRDQGMFNQQSGHSDTLQNTMRYMDNWLKQNGVSTKSFDRAMADLTQSTGVDPKTQGSLEMLATLIGRDLGAGSFAGFGTNQEVKPQTIAEKNTLSTPTLLRSPVNVEDPQQVTPSLPDNPGQTTEPVYPVPNQNEPSTNDPSTNDPSMNDPSMNDPRMYDPSMSDPSQSDPSKNDPAMNDPTHSQGSDANTPSYDTRPLGDAANNPPIATDGDIKGAKYKKQDVTLFPNGAPSSADIRQGRTGDCDVLSTLGSYADTHPDAIKNAIQDNKDGTFDVKMFDPSGTPITVKVDNQFAATEDGQVGVTGADGKLNWASVMEKALAKYNNVYGSINKDNRNLDGLSGQGPQHVLPALTGSKYEENKTSQGYGPNALSASDMKDKLVQALKNGQNITCGTGSYPDAVKGHGYTVLGIQNIDGKDQVLVRNPWGSDKNNKSANNDGVLQIPIDDFAKQFDIRLQDINGPEDPSSTLKTALTTASKTLGSIPAGAMKKSTSKDMKDLLNVATTGDVAKFTTAVHKVLDEIKDDKKGRNAEVLANALYQAIGMMNAGGKISQEQANQIGAL